MELSYATLNGILKLVFCFGETDIFIIDQFQVLCHSWQMNR